MTNPLLIRRLYRSLLKAAKPFSSPSPNAAVMSCLLHRTGIDDTPAFSWTHPSLGEERSVEDARDLSISYAPPTEPDTVDERMPSHVLFRKLLRHVVTGSNGHRQMQFPSEVDTTRLRNTIRREFRSKSSEYDLATRQQVAFFGLRELNKKLAWADSMSRGQETLDAEACRERNRRQAARHVSSLPLKPASYLKAGTYLVAHPLLTGFFRRTVILLLDHTDARGNNGKGGTYGLIVNRIAVSSSGKRRTLSQVLRSLPPDLAEAFGNCTVREGGPVHVALQMVHARTPDQPALGGNVLSVVGDEDKSTALDSDRAIYYQGNMMDAAKAVNEGTLDRDDVSFYVGASCWSAGQLESEIDRGYFIPCRGPPEVLLTGMCERVGDEEEGQRPKADLWLSVMSALGEDEANLAHLVSNNDAEYSEHGDACDLF